MSGGLLEREEAVAAIAEVVSAALDERRGCGILVRAPAGLGKTALLHAATQDIAGARVLRARASELERGFAFGVVRQLLARTLAEAAAEDRERWLDGPAAAAAPLLLGTAGAAGDESALLHALHWLLAGMAADAPLVLVCDDVHWCDDESLRFLTFLAHRVAELSLAVVAASRPDDPAAARGLLAALAAEPAMRVLTLAPLSAQATSVLARARQEADDAACAALLAATRGNPFLLGELLGALGDAGLPATAESVEQICEAVPEGLQDLVLGRLHRIGGDAVAVARAVAVLGDGAPAAAVAVLAGVDADALVEAERRLVAADVLARDAPLGFVHPLLRAAVLAELGPVATARWRARAAEHLADAGAPDEAVAAQLLEIEPVGHPWALHALEAAAEQALGRGAPGTAGRLYERALAEARPAPPPALLLAAGAALVTAGERRGVAHMMAAAEAMTDPSERAELMARLAIPMWFAGRSDEFAARAALELAAVDPADVSLRFRLGVQLAASATLGESEPVGPRVRQVLELAPRISGAMVEERAALAVLALTAVMARRPAALIADLALRALGTPAQHEESIAAGYPQPTALVALVLAEDPHDLREEQARMEAGVRRRGALALGLASCLAWRALTHAITGAIADAEVDARTAIELSPPAFPAVREPALAALGAALAETGRGGEALPMLDAHRTGAGVSLQLVQLARARVLLSLGRAAEAAEVAAAVGRSLAATALQADAPALAPWRTLEADARLVLGDRAQAQELAAAELALVGDFGADAPVGVALRTLGLATGDVALLEEAERRLSGAPRRTEHARALVELGAALRRGGRRAAAREPLAAGADLAARCGATVLLERAQVELRAAGARPRSVLRTGAEALTPSERRVAELATDGLTNREIAQRLFVTQKTVESQLRAVFRKLDVTSRKDLGTVLA